MFIWGKLIWQDVDGLHTPIGDPRRRGMYIKDLQAMIDG
jgi:hypothetical protein